MAAKNIAFDQEARTAIKAAWPRVLAWTIKQKLFGLRLGGGE